MVFNDTTNKTGLIQECEDQTNIGDGYISGDAKMLAKFTRWMNIAYMNVTNMAITSDGVWEYDDTNHTDQPIATTSLVQDQRDYQVLSSSPSENQDWLVVERVEIKDEAGNSVLLHPRDKTSVNTSIDERYKESGTPNCFDFEGTSIKLFPSPKYNSSGGMKLWFKRAPLLFLVSDTDKVPGFASLFHSYLALSASFKYLITKDIQRANNIKVLMQEMEEDMKEYFNKRSKYETDRLARTYRSYR